VGVGVAVGLGVMVAVDVGPGVAVETGEGVVGAATAEGAQPARPAAAKSPHMARMLVEGTRAFIQ
jgi:hypothetical protein